MPAIQALVLEDILFIFKIDGSANFIVRPDCKFFNIETG